MGSSGGVFGVFGAGGVFLGALFLVDLAGLGVALVEKEVFPRNLGVAVLDGVGLGVGRGGVGVGVGVGGVFCVFWVFVGFTVTASVGAILVIVGGSTTSLLCSSIA